jgi:hypothetical protein
VVIVLCWLLIPAAEADPGPERVATIVGLAGLIGAVILVPVRWFLRLGGREPTWELRRARVEVAQISNRVRRNPSSVPVERIQDAIARLAILRTSATAELCDLLSAELSDFITRSESWNEAGRRSIRIDELCRSIWPDDMPPPDFDFQESTFRWHLYRTFGRMMELATAEPTSASRHAFEQARDSLAQFRRDSTFRFLDAVQQSADRWLASPATGRPWIESFEFQALGPDGLSEVKRIWGREAAMWGARLDGDDLRALKEDLARRAAIAAEPAAAPAPAPEPAASSNSVVAESVAAAIDDAR